MKNLLPISKSSYLLGLRCPQALYNKYHQPELAQSDKDNTNEALLAAGNEFEVSARELIAPKGKNITLGAEHLDFDTYISRTTRELEKRNVVLYQATFQTKTKERVISDIIIKRGKKIDLIEIKAVTQLQDHHYYDVGYQYYCITKAGYNVNKVFLAHVNKEYVRDGELTKELVVMVDVTKKIKQIQRTIPLRLKYFRGMLKENQAPGIKIDHHCTDPYPCPFKNYCWSTTLPANNIFDIRGMRMKEKMNLYWAGIVSMEDVHKRNIRLNHTQKTQVTCTIYGTEIFETEKIREWLSQFKNEPDLYFLDFETLTLATPQYNKTKPYEQIPIQFSIHLKQSTGLTHFEYLADPNCEEDQRLELLENLIKILEAHPRAPIIAFNKSFEAGRLKYLSECFPQHKAAADNIRKRLIDLADVFREKWHYHPDMQGSYSIKYVLPVLAPELSYKQLEVRNGSQASAQYLLMKNSDKREQVRKALLEYCKLDTLAMVRILENLIKKVNSLTNLKIVWKQKKTRKKLSCTA